MSCLEYKFTGRLYALISCLSVSGDNLWFLEVKNSPPSQIQNPPKFLEGILVITHFEILVTINFEILLIVKFEIFVIVDFEILVIVNSKIFVIIHFVPTLWKTKVR